MTIVRTDYRPKRARERKQSPPIPHRIVRAKQPKPTGPVIDKAVATPHRPAAQAAAITVPRIVTASPRRMTRFGPVQEIDAEEHQRRGDAAEALFRELVRRATWNAGCKPPERYWRSYGTDPLPIGAEAIAQPLAAFPSWLLRVTCDRCGKDRMFAETHFAQRCCGRSSGACAMTAAAAGQGGSSWRPASRVSPAGRCGRSCCGKGRAGALGSGLGH